MPNLKRTNMVVKNTDNSQNRLTIRCIYGRWKIEEENSEWYQSIKKKELRLDSFPDSFMAKRRAFVWHEQKRKSQVGFDSFPDALIIGREIDHFSKESSEITIVSDRQRMRNYFLTIIDQYRRRILRMEEELHKIDSSVKTRTFGGITFDTSFAGVISYFAQGVTPLEKEQLGIVTGSFEPKSGENSIISRTVSVLADIHKKFDLFVTFLDSRPSSAYRKLTTVYRGLEIYKRKEIAALKKRTDIIERISKRLENKEVVLVLFPYLSSEIPRFGAVINERRKENSKSRHFHIYDPSEEIGLNVAHFNKELGLKMPLIAFGKRNYIRGCQFDGYEGTGCVELLPYR